jgi:hypothetical protein
MGGSGGTDDPCEGVDCSSDNDCVQDGTCDPGSGECVPGDNEPSGTACTDSGTVCDGEGDCVACNDAVDCSEAPQCSVSTCLDNICDEEAGPDDIVCDLLDVGDGICKAGTCVEPPPCIIAEDCPDMACTLKDCVLAMCDYQPDDGAGCEDEPGVPGTCNGNMCVSLCEGVTCPSSNECVMDGICDDQTGECIPGDDQPPGIPCDLLVSGDGVCDGQGACVECIGDEQCSAGQTCGDNHCFRECPPASVPAFVEDFEIEGPWSPDNGVWQIGAATAGPGSCFAGSQCAGTVLDGDYPPAPSRGTETFSRLISGTIVLPSVSGNEELHLRFRNWSEYGREPGGVDSGTVQISVRDEGGTFGAWESVGTAVSDKSGGWSIKDVDLTVYAGETVRIGFLHYEVDATYGGNPVGAGWYIDDIQIAARVSAFGDTEDFECGWVDWFADNGVWQIGAATAGPGSCFAGSQCAGTVLDGDYPPVEPRGTETFSRLISGTIVLPSVSGNEELHLRFRNWVDYGREQSFGVDSGTVQISVRDEGGMFGAWESVGTAVTDQSGGWTIKGVDLTPYAGETVRIGFLHYEVDSSSYGGNGFGAGWYIDDIELRTF